MSLNEVAVELPKAEAVAIEYPGFIRDTNKALSTLGGLDGIATAVSTKHYLKLKLRPEDRTSHPLYGERHEQQRLLLRIALRKQPSEGHQAQTTPSTSTTAAAPAAKTDAVASGVTVSVVARVTASFRFPGLADYAFIPYDPLLSSRSRDLLPYDQRPDRAEPTKALQPYLLIPQLFSWLDLPQDYAFKQVQSKHHIRGAARAEPNWGDAPVISFYAEAVPPPVASTSAGAAAAAAAASAAAAAKPAATSPTDAAATAVAGEAVGAAPVATAAAANGQASEAAGPAGIADVRAYRVLETEVSRLLAQRPVWGLALMRERCASCAAVQAAMPAGCDAAAVERVVQRLCYRFKTGPWRGLFIRRGYDPRVDAEARKYQAIIYSLPNNWYRNLLKAGLRSGAPRVGEAAADGAGGVAAAPPRGGDPDETGAPVPDAAGGRGGSTTGAAAGPALAPSCQDDLHNFRALPTHQTTTLQLIDLQLAEVQEALQEPSPAAEVGGRCSEKTGWLSNAALQRMQNAVQHRFLQLMDQLAPPGMGSSTAMAGVTAAGGVANCGAAGAPGAATRRGGPAAGSGNSQKPPAAAASADGNDVEMQDAVGAVAVQAGAAGGSSAGGGVADDALRALMAQMSLQGLSAAAADRSDDLGVAGLFGSDDDDDEFRLLDEQDEQAGGRGGLDGEGGGAAAMVVGRERVAEGRRGEHGAAAAGGGGDGKEDEEVLAGDGGSDGEDSALESEYDIGIGEEEEEEDEDEDEDGGEGVGGNGGGRRMGSGYVDNIYGRVTVPYGGGAPDARYDGGVGGSGRGGMFGSEEDDEPY